MSNMYRKREGMGTLPYKKYTDNNYEELMMYEKTL